MEQSNYHFGKWLASSLWECLKLEFPSCLSLGDLPLPGELLTLLHPSSS